MIMQRDMAFSGFASATWCYGDRADQGMGQVSFCIERPGRDFLADSDPAQGLYPAYCL